MRSKKRQFSAISLSFLDVMSCGFGAFILLFLIIKHQANMAFDLPEDYLEIEIGKLRSQIEGSRNLLQSISESSSTIQEEIRILERDLLRLRTTIASNKNDLEENKDISLKLQILKKKFSEMQLEKASIAREQKNKPSNVRTFVGEGDREYLSGMQLGGERILVLVDHSASMLDKSIVNVIRKRNMSNVQKRNSKKWKQAISTVDWITARFPENSWYQIYGFNENPAPVLLDTKGQWLRVAKFGQLETAFSNMREIVPSGGSSLENAFLSINTFTPAPDNIYLITDGLPTVGRIKTDSTTITGKQRLKLFESAVENLPSGIPVNTILLPMEGDPLAPWAFWGIAAITKGSFLSPASDWP